MAAGDFSASAMNVPILRARQMWGNELDRQVLDKDITTIQAIAENQNSMRMPVYVNGKCIGYKVFWLEDCQATGDDECTTDAIIALGCDVPAGDEAEAGEETYEFGCAIDEKFTVDDSKFCANEATANEVFAMQLNRAIGRAEERLNNMAIAWLKAQAQVNAFPEGGSVSGTETSFSASLWTASIVAKLRISAMRNKVYNPIFINGSNLYEAYYTSQFNVAGCCDNKASNMLAAQKMYWDLTSLDAVVGDQSTFVVDPAKIGFINRSVYSANPTDLRVPGKEVIGFSVASQKLRIRDVTRDDAGNVTGSALVPFRYDVLVERTCKDDRAATLDFQYVRNTQVMAQYEFINAPAVCSGGSGILQFNCV